MLLLIVNMKISPKSPRNNGKVRQFIAAIILNLVCLTYGASVGWISPTMPQLQSTKPPIGNTPMTKEQISWLNSLLPIGGLLTIPFCGILSQRIGTKKFAHLIGFPIITSWLLIIFAQNYHHLLIARLFVGMTGAMIFFIVPIYVSDIASEDIRGILGSLLLFSLNIGVLFAYVAGTFLSYRMFASITLIFPTVFVVAFSLMPETPVYLARRNLHDQAFKSLMYFRGDDKAVVERELETLSKTSNGISKKVGFADLFKDRATRKGLIISFGLLFAQQLSGIFAMMSYATTIFKLTGSTLSSDVASIIIAVIQIVGSYASTMLIERAGRRILTLVSCFGMALSHAVVASFFYLQKNDYDVSLIAWLPLVALSIYMVTFCLGVGPVPFVVISEVFSLDATSRASTVCFVFYFIVCFTAIRSFDLAMLYLGSDGCFFMLASLCAVSYVFCYCLLPETKGRKREDIVAELAGIDRNCREKLDVVDENGESNTLMKSEPV